MRLTPDAAALMQQVDSTAGRLALQMQRLINSGRRELNALATRPLFASPRRTLDAYGTSLSHMASRLGNASRTLVLNRSSAVERMSLRLERCRPAALAAARQARLATASSQLHQAMRHRLKEETASIEAISRQLTSVSPLRVLERGYSVTMTADGTLVKSASDVLPGQQLVTKVADGSITSTVDADSKGAAAAPVLAPVLAPVSPAASPAPRRASSKRASTDTPEAGPSLFA
jgi:exodeoxyribonuclease VII large subunit